MRFFEMVPDVDALLALEPEELAGVLLAHLNTTELQRGMFHPFHFFNDPRRVFAEYPNRHEEIAAPFMEAWVWLEREGLIVPDTGSSNGWMRMSRRGARLTSRVRVDADRRGNLLPRGQLHPAIAQSVWATFLRGDYDTAVFQAFKEVEVAVRAASGLGPTDLGTDLMRKAFDKQNGKLTDKKLPVAEREAMAHYADRVA